MIVSQLSTSLRLLTLFSFILLFFSADLVSAFEVGDVVDSLFDFSNYYDKNGKLSTHLLVYPESCSAVIDEHLFQGLKDENVGRDHFYNRKIHPVTGYAEKAFFGSISGGSTIDDCDVVCVERGVDRSLIRYPLPHLYYKNNDEGSRRRLDFWYIDTCEAVAFGFINYHDKVNPVNVYWVNPIDGTKILNRRLQYGEQKTEFISTIIGHKFLLEDFQTGETLLEHVVEFEGIRAIGEYIPDETVKEEFAIRAEEMIKDTVYHEWDRHDRIKRTFSSTGFATGRLPNDVFGSMGSYYYNNVQYKVLEEWDGKGVFVNWWEVDCHFIQISWRLKQIWQVRLLELVEEWVNEKLEQTDMYGIRQYEPGARLLTHVDRESTHAASLIVNVAQGNITDPWRVEVHDHADRLHEVTMKPGDVVYYESARCLHGRNTPLKGGYYANLFTHYRPIGDPDWFYKANPPGNPEPLIDVGKCQLVGDKNKFSEGSVQCDDHRIGKHLSPTQFVARNGHDLFHYWKNIATGDADVKSKEESVAPPRSNSENIGSPMNDL